MPDISKINAVAVADIEKLDSILAANIEKVNGLTFPAGGGLLLDTYTNATAGFSVRLLRTLYTGPCMRIRRASDNVEADVGFDSSDIFGLTSPISNTSDAQSYTDLADFVDHTGTPTDAMVCTWYDQSTYGDNATQLTYPNQCQIYDAVNGIIKDNGFPCIQPQSNNQFLTRPARPVIDKTMFLVVRATASLVSPLAGSNNAYVLIAQSGGTSTTIDQSVDGADYRIDGATYTTTTRAALYNEVSPNVVLASILVGRDTMRWAILGSTFSSVTWYQSTEMVFFDDDEFTSGNLSGIEENIGDYYQIPGM